jgi:hypothetical protein
MLQNVELQGQTKQLLDGPLKHIRAAALAAALVPLASVFAAPAAAQTDCASGGIAICGTVFNDTNTNGFLDTGDTPLTNQPEVLVLCTGCPVTDTITLFPNASGNYSSSIGQLDANLTYTVTILIPTGYQTSPTNPGSVGSPAGAFSVATGVSPNGLSNNFGFFPSAALNPGTGTPGYWKNHPNAWPVSTITVGGVTYTKAAAIAWLGQVGKDKTTTMFSSLLPAKLNVMIGNDRSCVQPAIDAGDAWMALYGPVGNHVAASSDAWAVGEPIHQTLDAYNNGLLCAPHRN